MNKLKTSFALPAIFLVCAFWSTWVTAEEKEIEEFNQKLTHATLNMDNEATLLLWADDGVSLLPSTKPVIGKTAIAKMMSEVTAQMPGAHMTQFDFKCFDIVMVGNWASEWCTEHQIVQFSGGKKSFDGWGKLLLVLQRNNEGQWVIEREMWNQAEPEK
ncbi:uncharacterized protein (TIGR02246 family) [Oxalobacteraceae bacterium GrIS 2.11]